MSYPFKSIVQRSGAGRLDWRNLAGTDQKRGLISLVFNIACRADQQISTQTVLFLSSSLIQQPFSSTLDLDFKYGIAECYTVEVHAESDYIEAYILKVIMGFFMAVAAPNELHQHLDNNNIVPCVAMTTAHCQTEEHKRA
jgi:hypothetical protein